MKNHPVQRGAVLYTVQGPRGSYYAVHDPATGRIFTESTDPRARAQARDVGLIITAEETISHPELLRRTGREADAATQSPRPKSPPQPLSSPDVPTVPDVAAASMPSETFLLDDTGESTIVRRAAAGVFSSHPLEPRYSDFSDHPSFPGPMPILHPPEEDWKAPERI